METVLLNVHGMSCGKCVKAVEDSVGILSGVLNVNVDLQAATVEVDFDEEQITVDEIKDTIDDQGYDVQ